METSVDISVFMNDVKLNIRSAVIIETENGYIFNQDKRDGFYYIIGGRIKINETSEDAAKREVCEEIGIKIGHIKLKAIMESFFVRDDKKFHEICFYYKYKTNETISLPKNFFVLDEEEMKTKEIQPKNIYEIINSKDNDILHIVANE
jgi:8-oxo-dGTP pyrophosphatase MutT (NUDIX family)